MKKKNSTSCSILFLVILFITSGCQIASRREENISKFQYEDIKIHDIGKKFEASDVKAILFTDWPIIEECESVQVLGNLNEVEDVIGEKIKARIICAFDDPNWLGRITKDFFEEAKRTPKDYFRGYLDDARAIFITRDKGYRLKITSDDKFFYGPDFESKLLKEHLKEIGFEPEPLPQSKESILGLSLETLCGGKTLDDIRKEINISNVDTIILTDWFMIEKAKTVIVLGSLSKAESIIGKKIKTQKVVDDTLLISRITKDCLEAKHTEKGIPLWDKQNTYLGAVFITKDDKCCMLNLVADNKNKIVYYGPGYESEQIWKDLEMVGFIGIEKANRTK